MEYKDYYQTLGVSRDAKPDEIKRAYRKLARKYHPDVSKESDAEERFKSIGEAYEVLKDSQTRAAYDQLGANWKAGQEFRPPPGWDQSFRFESADLGRGGFGGGGGQVDFSDFFEALFSERAARGGGGGARGADQKIRVRISLEDAYNGAERVLQLQGGGSMNGGTVSRARKLNVKIPSGVTDGQQIRLAGQGQPGFGGGPSGDLFLSVEIEAHPIYRVDAKDVHLDLPIAPWEAALGATIKVPTLGGKVDLKIPAGSQSGGKLRLKGRGLGGKVAGDQYVVLQIVAPKADSDAARQLYEQMAAEMPFDPRAHLDR